MRLRGGRLSSDELWLADLQLWAISQLASVWLIDIKPYEPCRVAGIVVRWRIDPTEGYIEATLFDGTGELLARWPSINRPSPLRVSSEGRGLVLEGVPAVGPRGEIMMLDPRFRRALFPMVV